MGGGVLKTGCVVFDDPCTHTTGWKAVGYDKAERVNFQGTGSLSTDIVFITNLDYNLSYDSGLIQNYRFQTSEYLKEDCYEIANRLGITDNSEIAEFVSQYFTRVMMITRKMLRVREDANFIPRFTLRNGLREMYWAKDPIYQKEIYDIIQNSISYNTNCERTVNKNEEVITKYVRVPSRIHCRNVLTCQLPRGELKELGKKDMIPKNASRENVVDWLCGLNPGFFKVVCTNFDDDFNQIINYGTSPGNSNNRQWLSSLELAFISNFADVKVIQGLVAADKVVLPEIIDLTNTPDIADASISFGCFFDNVWSAMATTLKNPMTPKGKGSINPFIPFLRAQDRIELFKIAVALQSRGYEVLGYASGNIRINVNDVDLQSLYDVCKELHCIPPNLGLTADDIQISNDPEPLELYQWANATGQVQQIMDMDRAIVEDYIIKGGQ